MAWNSCFPSRNGFFYTVADGPNLIHHWKNRMGAGTCRTLKVFKTLLLPPMKILITPGWLWSPVERSKEVIFAWFFFFAESPFNTLWYGLVIKGSRLKVLTIKHAQYQTAAFNFFSKFSRIGNRWHEILVSPAEMAFFTQLQMAQI